MLPVAILCGGLGTRLLPKTETVPKALLSVSGEPFVFHQLRLLASAGVRRAVLCVGHLGGMIESAVGNGSAFGLDVGYAYDGDVQLGTGGAIRNALPQLGESFFTLYGDSYLVADFGAIQTAFESSRKLGLMTIWHNSGRLVPSNVEVQDQRIVAYSKRSRSERMQHVDWGLSAFRSETFEAFARDEVFDLGQVHVGLLDRGQLAAFEVKERFYEVGSPEGLADTEAFIGKLPQRF
jgi:NDP-sugar pyrophosphorylase family protein